MESVAMATSSPDQRALTLDNINPHVKKMHYGVRGPILVRSNEIEKELLQGVKKPFTKVIRANFGDGHTQGQPPITFLRQVLATACHSPLMNDPSIPDDVKERVKLLLGDCRGGSIGSYTESVGVDIVRQHVAEYIERRDGIPTDMENIVLCNGASDGIRTVMKMFMSVDPNSRAGMMTPLPQYPFYSALMLEMDFHQMDYYLDESRGWGITVEELKRSINEARKHCTPRAIVIINPGNPAGQVLTKKNIQEIVKFAYEERILILADEVYQENIHDESCEFHSFKKVMFEMGPPYCNMELTSFMTCSKGYYGECGVRGGYIEIHNFERDVYFMLKKATTALLCPNVLGSFALDCVVKPPQPGDPSYPQFAKEKRFIKETLVECAKYVTETLNSIPGMTCNAVQGALYAFPQIDLPLKAIKAAEDLKLHPDAYYCFELLEKAGVCLVPGSSFCQEKGTYHFRVAIFPNLEVLQEILRRIMKFHKEFVRSHQ